MYRNEINEATKVELINEIKSNSYDVEYKDIELEELRESLIEELESNGDWIETIEDDILDSICNGNWNEGAKLMLEESISIFNLIDFVEEISEELGYNVYSWFDRTAVANLASVLN